MAAVLDELARVLRQFVQTLGGVDGAPSFAVVGGLAVSVRTEPRFTRDVDVVVAVADDAAAEALGLLLQRCGYQVVGAFEHENGRMSTVRFRPPGGDPDGVLVDLLFASSGIEAELAAEAEVLEVLPGISLPVAQTGHLIALKLLSVEARRPNDAHDLVALCSVASPEDLASAEAAISLITQRGYHRGRDLPAALSTLLANI